MSSKLGCRCHDDKYLYLSVCTIMIIKICTSSAADAISITFSDALDFVFLQRLCVTCKVILRSSARIVNVI